MSEEKTVRIQDDLYEYVNGEWLKTAVIPDDKPATGGFVNLSDDVEKILMKDFKDMASKKKKIPNDHIENAVELYKKAINVKRRNKDGIKPILKDLKAIQNLTSISLFNRKLKDSLFLGYPLPFSIGVETNMKDTSHHCFVLAGPSTILPDTTYYDESQKATHDALIGLWSQMVTALLKYTDLSEEEQALYLQDTIKFDAIIATLVKSQQEWADYAKCHNPTKLSSVTRALGQLKLRKLLNKLYDPIPSEIIVYDPKFLKGFKTLFNEETYPLYQHWAYVNYLLDQTPYLSEELRELGGTYHRALTGVAKEVSIEKQAYRIASGKFDQPVGLYYGQTYFGEQAKQDVVDIVKEIIATYKKRMQNNDFLEETTKEKAILKLDKIAIKMGYPDKVDSIYNLCLVFPRDNLVTALNKLRKVRVLDNLGKLYKEVDRTEWVMPGHMVNACYDPNKNDITFPAAILQAPFYSLKQTRSENLGGIGAVIGHEISHAFDNNGAQFDENGNLNNWWSKQDLKVFKQKTKAMIKQFDGIPFAGGHVNGTLVVSENIADNGGMAVTLDIMSQMSEKNYEEYFLNWARVWCQKAKEEYQQLLLRVDVHSPALLRANMQPRNFQEWYDTFNVTKNDQMYLPISKRVHIW